MSKTMMHVIFALLVITNGLVVVKSYTTLSEVLPFLGRCNRYQDDLPQCIRNSIESMKGYLKMGILLWNIPSFEPYVPHNFEFILNEEFYGEATFKNTRIYGITNYTIHQVEVPTDANYIKFQARFPFIQVFTTYGVNATINNVFIEQPGMQATANITNLKAEIELDGEYYFDHDLEEEYFRLNYVLVRLEVGRNRISVNPITDKKKYKKKTERQFLKDSLKIVARQTKKSYESTAASIISEIANRIYSFPMKMVFPQ